MRVHGITHTPRRTMLIASAGVLGAALTGCGFSVRNASGAPNFTPEELVDTAEFCTLNELGIARAKASKSLRLDFRAGSIPKSDVGLPDSAYGPDAVAKESEKFQLTTMGTAGTLTAQTDHVRFGATDTSPIVDSVHYFPTVETLEDDLKILRDAVDSYGPHTVPVERWIASAQENPGKKSSYAVGAGKSLGFDVEYDLRYDGSKKQQVISVGVLKGLQP